MVAELFCFESVVPIFSCTYYGVLLLGRWLLHYSIYPYACALSRCQTKKQLSEHQSVHTPVTVPSSNRPKGTLAWCDGCDRISQSLFVHHWHNDGARNWLTALATGAPCVVVRRKHNLGKQFQAPGGVSRCQILPVSDSR